MRKCSLQSLERLVYSVWFSFEAVIIEKTLKEDWTNKNNFYDNYNYYSDTMIITTTFAHSVAILYLLTHIRIS